ncbi:MAG TPA: hypothetical protein VJT75_01540 [Thermoleophilaceae bacterium]|nr:hypothetical protein [Thermoleophilaceae bacterium]
MLGLARSRLAALVVLAAAGTLAPTASAAPPANDDFAASQVLLGTAGSSPGTTAEATREVGEPKHGSPGYEGGNSVWYRWVAPATGTAWFRGASPHVLAVYTGSTLAGLDRVPPNVENSFGEVRFHAVAGTEYRIAVDTYFKDRTFSYDLEYSVDPPPPNDSFLMAQTLTGDTPTAIGDNYAATVEQGEPLGYDGYNYSAASSGRTLWYRWTAPADGGVTVDTVGSATDHIIGVYTGDVVSALTPVAGFPGWAWFTGQPRRVAFRATAGVTYRVQVDGGAGDVKLQLRRRPRPANDRFADAVDLGSSTDPVSGRNDGATIEDGEPAHPMNSGWGTCSGICRGAESSVWYRWTAPKTGSLTVKTQAPFLSMPIVYTGASVASLAPVARQPQPNTGLPNEERVRVEAGVTYHVAVEGVYLSTGDDFGLELQLTDLPPNDDFANAEALSGMEVNRGNEDVDTNVGATQEPGEPVHGGNGIDPSVWYRWKAPATGEVRIETSPRSLTAPVTAVYTGDTVGSLTAVPLTRAPGTSRQYRFEAVAGTTYRIAVDGASGQQGTFALSLWEIVRPPNDRFANATQLTGGHLGVQGRTLGATAEAGEPLHADKQNAHSIWYRWTAPSDGSLEVRTNVGGITGVLGVYTGGAVNALSEVASADEGSETNASVTLDVHGGTSYWLALDGYDFQGSAESWYTELFLDFTPDEGATKPKPRPLTISSAIGTTRMDAVLARGLPVKATCNRACSVELRVLIEKTAARTLGVAPATAARTVGVRKTASAKRVRIALKLSQSLRAKLRQRRSLPLVLRVAGQAGGARASKRVAVTLHR